MNLSPTIRIVSGYGSTGNPGSTGDAVALSTAAAVGSTTVSPGGFPFASTGFDMRGYEGVVGIATYLSASTGGGAGTSGIATLQFYAGVSSTSLSQSFVPLQGAYVTGYSTTPAALVLDVARPKLSTTLTAGQFQFQAASSSQAPDSITILLYGAKLMPTTNSTAQNTAGTGSFVAGYSAVISPGT